MKLRIILKDYKGGTMDLAAQIATLVLFFLGLFSLARLKSTDPQ
jgi:hypothetical protein